jgi:uncharacterized protein (DUF342 family)
MTALLKERYRLDAQICDTPAGVFYCGHDGRFNKKVIIRLLDGFESEEQKTRFSRQAKSQGLLSHPSIVSVTDYGFEENTAFSVHEHFNAGESVFMMERLNLFEPEEKTRAAKNILEALIYAYSKNILHRNLYTDCVYISDGGEVKLDLFDFRRYLSEDRLIGEFGIPSGAYSSIPPEEIKGGESNLKGDIYRYGCLLYTILTGRPPFSGKNFKAAINNIRRGEYVNPAYLSKEGGAFFSLIERCLKLVPAERYSRYEEILDDFRSIEAGGKSKVSKGSPFKLETKDGGLFLTVSPIMASRITAADIEKRLLDENFFDYSTEDLNDRISKADGRAHRIGSSAARFDPLKFRDVNIEVSADAMSAYLRVPPDCTVTAQELIFFLKKRGIRTGIDEKTAGSIAADRKFCDIPAAKGTPPEKGEDAFIHYFFERDNLFKPKELESGDVDFKEISAIQQAKEGQVLCIKIPATAGTAGKTVFGDSIDPEEGDDIMLPAGENTQVTPDGLKLISVISGQITMDSGSVNIKEILIINGDVDYNYGNVRYKGDIIIRGDVLPDFSVTAGGDIKIHGVVESAQVESLRGSVTIKSGVFGKDKGKITALKDIKADFLQDVSVFCGRNLTVDNYVLNSKVWVGRHFKCVRGTGNVAGSSVEAGATMDINIAGAKPYVKTYLTVNRTSRDMLKAKISDLLKRQAEASEAVSNIKKNAKRILLKLGSLDAALEDREYMMNMDKAALLTEHLEEISVRLSMAREDFQERDSSFVEHVNVRRLLYTDVHIKIAGGVFTSRTDYDGKIYATTDGERVLLSGI